MKPKHSSVYDKYWQFAFLRQEVFFNKIKEISPLTTDPILQTFKFTNTYRSSDRTSQFLIRNVIYKGNQSSEEVFFRILIFKIFNKIDTWKYLENKLGEMTVKSFSFDKYSKLLDDYRISGGIIYNNCYMMTGVSEFGLHTKHHTHLKVIERMLKDRLPDKVTKSKKLEGVFNLIKNYPTLGDFTGFQYSIDINYSNLTDFSENSFVKCGPGALSGIKKCFSDIGNYTPEDIVKYMTDNQEKEFERLGLNFQTLWGRPLQLIDCQNLFCETDKYTRVSNPEVKGLQDKKRIKQNYKPSKSEAIEYFFPPKWGINENIS